MSNNMKKDMHRKELQKRVVIEKEQFSHGFLG